MASGNDARFALAKETTYGTRVAPSRFIGGLTGESVAFTRNRAYSAALGQGRNNRPSVLTNRGGSGTFSGEVPNAGFGYLLEALHGNTVTPVQIAATTAYTQTHTLDSAPVKSYTFQKQVPPVLSNTLVPLEYTGVMFSGLTISWSTTGLLTFSMDCVVQEESTSQTAVTYVAPPAWSPFAGVGGSVTIGGVAEANVLGDGSITLGTSMRTDAYALGGGGVIAKPVEVDKPVNSASFTADFNDLTNVNRVVNNTVADAVFKWEGPIIAGGNKYTFQVTLPDCVFESPSPTVDGPGVVSQAVTMTAASTTGDAPVIVYISTDSSTL